MDQPLHTMTSSLPFNKGAAVALAALVCNAFCAMPATAQASSATSQEASAPQPGANAPQTEAGGGAAATLPVVRVDSSALSDMQTQSLPSYKFTAPLIDTPRSITVIPQEVIKEKNASTFEDALRTVPGITFTGGDAAANPSADRPVLRGFESRNSIFVDGMRDSGVQNRETFDVQSVSVIKGPDSVYAGRGAVGGSIDIETKAPQADDFFNSSVGLGTDSYRRSTVDWNHALGENSAFRLNLMGHDADQAGRTDVYSKRWGVAPSIAFGLNRPTTVTFSYYHMNNDDMPDFSVPFGPNGGTPIASRRGQFYGLNARDYRHGQTDTGQVKVEHRFNDDWKVRNTTVYGRSTLDYIATNPQLISSGPYAGMLALQAKSGKYATNSLANQTELSGKFDFAGMRHTLTTGLELSKEQDVYSGYLVSDSTGANMRSIGSSGFASCAVAYNCAPVGSWNPGNPWTGSVLLNGDMKFPGPATYTTTNIASAYLFDSMKISERWLFNAGVRLDNYRVHAQQGAYVSAPANASVPAADLSNDSTLLSYQFGPVFKPVPELSLYASYGTSSNPPGANSGLGGASQSGSNNQLTASTQNLAPERSRNIEVGAKWDVLDRRLSLTTALFQTDRTNAIVSDGLGGYTNAGSQRVRGVEFGFAGSLTRKWKMFGGYSYLDAITTGGGPSASGAALSGTPMTMVPKHSFTLWTSYDVLPRVNVGAGVTLSSLVYASVSATRRNWTPGYAKFDAAVTWHATKSMDLQLNVNNIFDKQYYQTAYPIYATWAPGRSAVLTMNLYL